MNIMINSLRNYLHSVEGQPLCVDVEGSMFSCLKQYEHMTYQENTNYIILGDEDSEDECYIEKRKIDHVCSDSMSCTVVGKGVQLEIHQ